MPPPDLLCPATRAFIEFLSGTANLPPSTDILRLQERSIQSLTLHNAALLEVRSALTPNEGERLNLRMGRLRTLAIACPSENLRNPPGSYADAYGRFIGEMEAFRGYMIELAGRLDSQPVATAVPKTADGTAGRTGTADVPPKKTKGKNIEAKMLKLLADKPHEVVCWSAAQWATALDCAESSVKETRTWAETLRRAKALDQAERINQKKPRRGRRKGE
jgi:hypothetical protein